MAKLDATLETVRAAYKKFAAACPMMPERSFTTLFLTRKTKGGKNNNAHPFKLRMPGDPVTVRDLPPEKYASVAKHVELWLEQKAATEAKLEAAKSKLEAQGREIAERIKIADKALAELKDKAGGALKAFVDHRAAIAKMLADAADECKALKMPFEEFRKKYAPNFQRSLTYELIAIGQGKLTLEDRTAAATKRKQKSRAAAKIAATVTYKSDDGRTVVTKCKTLAEAKTLAANCEGADAVIEATTVEKCRITKAIHKAEASGDAAALAAALAERETADMIFRETMTIGSNTFPVFKLNYENDFSDGFENGCLTREEIAANARYKEAAEGDTLTKPVEVAAETLPVTVAPEIAPYKSQPVMSTAEEVSDLHLSELKKALNAHYTTELLPRDRADARRYFNAITEKLTKLERKAA